MQRSHLHAGALGTTAVALSMIIVLLGVRPLVARTVSIAAGAGALGYSLFWVWAGSRAPGLGSTGAAKESLAWLAIPSSGLVVAATVAVLVLIVARLWRPAAQPAPRPTTMAVATMLCAWAVSGCTPATPAPAAWRTWLTVLRRGSRSVAENPIVPAVLTPAERAMFVCTAGGFAVVRGARHRRRSRAWPPVVLRDVAVERARRVVQQLPCAQRLRRGRASREFRQRRPRRRTERPHGLQRRRSCRPVLGRACGHCGRAGEGADPQRRRDGDAEPWRGPRTPACIGVVSSGLCGGVSCAVGADFVRQRGTGRSAPSNGAS